MRPKGLVRDGDRPTDLTPHARLVGTVAVPPTAMIPARIDDQQGQSCTGSRALLVEMYCTFRGIPCEPVSRHFNNNLGRALADPESPLRDLGADPASVVGGMRTIGITTEARYPSTDLSAINVPLDFYNLEIACTHQVDKIAVIEEDGDARCAAIRQAIAAGFPVGIAFELDQSFEDWSSDRTYTGHTSAYVGNHDLRVCGYRPGSFRIANSWGPGWGDGGYIWVADSFVGSSRAFDPYVLSFAPSVKS